MPSFLQQRLQTLDSLLLAHRWLWQPQPFKQAHPAWCHQLPELAEQLLALSDEQLRYYSSDPLASLSLLTPHLPALTQLPELCQIDETQNSPLSSYPAALSWDIPGRKWQQIESFVSSMKKSDANKVVEWCGGKGHLGRLISQQYQIDVHTLEYNPALCQEGERLAKRSKVQQQFYPVDVLSHNSRNLLQNNHVVALHACGELHRHLLRESITAGTHQLQIAPCCYHLGNNGDYHPFNRGLKLKLSRDDLRLAVTETVTAQQREIKQRDQEMAWKLGYVELRNTVQECDHYRPIRPINKTWLRQNFEQFCHQLAQRDSFPLPPGIDWSHFEAEGWRRQHEVMRLILPRQSFRRALECWLVFDMGGFLQNHGYQIKLSRFCDSRITPRNILIDALLIENN